jgi:hypothetical protein
LASEILHYKHYSIYLDILVLIFYWDENSKQFIDCDLLYSKLIDRRNCISKYSKIKKCIPKDGIPFHPYYSVKDIVGVVVFLMIFSAVVFFAPAMSGSKTPSATL